MGAGASAGRMYRGNARGLSLGWQQTQQAIELDGTASTHLDDDANRRLDRLEHRGRFTIQR